MQEFKKKKIGNLEKNLCFVSMCLCNPGVQVSRSLGEEWGTERRPCCHLHAHGATGHVHHVGLCTDRCPTQPHFWRLRL